MRPGTSNRPGTSYRPSRSNDHRYARPDYRYVRTHPSAHYRVPSRSYYRPYYTRWYCHPYYRSQYSTTVVVHFGYRVDPWGYGWQPQSRAGFLWVPGGYSYGYWNPGYWRPAQQVVYSGYSYVPGWWYGDNYVEGYYRRDTRTDGDWVWVDGYYMEDGSYVWGYWMPTKAGPQGYVWEPGFFDGENYVDGFWRPQFRRGFAWVAAFYDEDGVFNGGYWMPAQLQDGFTWVPGWFDGNEWIEGYWVRDEEFINANVQDWQPEEGWNDGWDVGGGWGDGSVVENRSVQSDNFVVDDDAPLALPIAVP